MTAHGYSIEDLPHSRACDFRPHHHGVNCHSSCETCGGRPPLLAPPAPVPNDPVGPELSGGDLWAVHYQQGWAAGYAAALAAATQAVGALAPRIHEPDADYDTPPLAAPHPGAQPRPGRDQAGVCTVCKAGPEAMHSEACPHFPPGGYPTVHAQLQQRLAQGAQTRPRKPDPDEDYDSGQ